MDGDKRWGIKDDLGGRVFMADSSELRVHGIGYSDFRVQGIRVLGHKGY